LEPIQGFQARHFEIVVQHQGPQSRIPQQKQRPDPDRTGIPPPLPRLLSRKGPRASINNTEKHKWLIQPIRLQFLPGNFKEVYGDLHNLIPDTAKLMKLIPFKPKAKIGNEYVEAVKLTHEHGITYSSDNNAGALVTLSTPIPLTLLDAKVTSRPCCSAPRSVTTRSLAPKVATKLLSKMLPNWLSRTCSNQSRSASKFRLLYGSSATGIGGVPQAGTTAPGNGALTVVLSAAQWATGIWVGSENALVDFYHGATKLNSTAAMRVVTVNPDTYTITFLETDATTDTSAAAINTYVTSNADAYIVFTGSYGNEMVGIDAAVSEQYDPLEHR
jgi:hypothetical protein